MPIQAPQWTEFLSCPVCFHEFDETQRRPISLGCGHTVCRACLGQLHRRHCPFDQTPISRDPDRLPANYALLQLLGSGRCSAAETQAEAESLSESLLDGCLRHYAAAKSCVEDLAWLLKPLGKGTSGNSSSGGGAAASASAASSNCLLSKPMQRKLVALVNCQLVEEEGRSRAVRAARSLGERTVTELILQHQNQQQLSANLWAAVRARGCQFLGPAMQEETLKLVLLALEDGAALSRKVLVMFVVQKLEQQFPQASKTSVGHVVQLLYRASCFMVTKRDEESSLMQLKDEFRNYEALRREHDAQIVQIAMEAGLRISPEQWSSLLYGDLNHKSHMQSIIDKLQTPASFATSIQELTIALQRSGDPAQLGKLTKHLDHLAAIDPNPDAGAPSWSDLEQAMVAVKTVVQGLVDFAQNHSLNKKSLEQQQTQNIKYKTSMCRDISQKGGCPRGSSCTFAHSEEELERFRAKSRRMLSALNRQLSSQNKATERARTEKLIARGVHEDGLSKEDRHDLMELQQQVASRNKREMTGIPHRPSAAGAAPVAPPSGNQPPDRDRDRDWDIDRDRDRDTAVLSAASSSAWSYHREEEPLPQKSYGREMPGSQQKSPARMPSDYPMAYYTSPQSSSPELTSRSRSNSDLYDSRPNIRPAQARTRLPPPGHRELPISHQEPVSGPATCSHYGRQMGPGEPRYTNTMAGPVLDHHYGGRDFAAESVPHPISSPGPVSRDKASAWDTYDRQERSRQDLVRRTVGAGKPGQKSVQMDPSNSSLSQDISLGELCERKQEILHQLRGFHQSENKNPWDRSQSLTKTVTSLWTIPTDSISKQRPSNRNSEDIVCYNPWTSQAPFCLIRPVKETNTNYTMTYIKAHVRHMSVDDHHNSSQDKPMGTHELSEFKKMTLEDLENTLQRVKKEDEQAGSSHYERGHKIQLEMDRRHMQQHPVWETSIVDHEPTNHKMRAQSDPRSYRSEDQQEMMRYYQTLPLGAHPDIRFPGHSPIIKSSRTTFKSTGPIQVNAGPVPETNPVTLTQDCLVAPSFQSSPSDGYHYHGQDTHAVSTSPSVVSSWPTKGSGSKSPQLQQGPHESDIEQQLKNELADVSQEIQKKVLNKNARDIVLLEQAAHALDPSVSSASPHKPISIYETCNDGSVHAKQSQQQELDTSLGSFPSHQTAKQAGKLASQEASK